MKEKQGEAVAQNTARHTPGPWINNATWELQNADRHICVDDGQWSRVIARVKHTDKDDALANARLIAAAPDLLEALKELLALGPVFRDIRAFKRGRRAYLSDHKSAIKARAAIAKATD